MVQLEKEFLAILLAATIGGVRVVLPTGDPPLESLKIGASFTIRNSSLTVDDVLTLVVFLGTNMNLGILEAEATFFLDFFLEILITQPLRQSDAYGLLFLYSIIEKFAQRALQIMDHFLFRFE